MQKDTNKSVEIRGYFYALQAYVFWGVLPIYWKMVKHVPPIELLAHRILWSFIFIIILLYFRKNLHFTKLFRQKRLILSLLFTAGLIGANWGIFIYAVNSDQLLEASMGYYIIPLISISLGIVFLKERLNWLKIIAIIFVVCGVLYITYDFGHVPWIALAISGCFGMYGLLKKITPVDVLNGLAIETLILLTPALWFIGNGLVNGSASIFNHSIKTDFLLIITGVVSILPLFWFAMGARRIPLASIGFLQYIAPSIMLLLGVFMFNEAFTKTHLVSFVCIWSGLVLYTISLFRSNEK